MFTEKEEKILNLLVKIQTKYDNSGEIGFSDVMLEDIFSLFPELSAQSVVGILGSISRKGFITTMGVNGEYNIYYLTKKAREYFNMELE